MSTVTQDPQLFSGRRLAVVIALNAGAYQHYVPHRARCAEPSR
jgi:hypothetical protein